MDKAEEAFMKSKSITDEEGQPVLRTWQVTWDDGLFRRLTDEFCAMDGVHGMQDDINRAKAELAKAEDALIEYGLSIVPAGISQTLKGNLHKIKVREKLLDLAFRLDTRTVPRKGRKA